jgi:DNA repair exonuclease SbcCD ATPase subunit
MNFLSTGNNPTEIQLDRSPTTLIVGKNGTGKSTLLDALSFVLFGKAHRNVNKNQLINSINGKGALVTIDFTIGNQDFKIVRGIKPNIFEIYRNDSLVDQTSQSRDYQKHLEQNILKLNHKSFHQIVVLGSSSFVPFMQLPLASRREIIEDLLDIQIFSKMNAILKEKMSIVKSEIVDINHTISLVKEKIDMQKKYITDITQMTSDQVEVKKKKITEISEEIEELNIDIKTYKESLSGEDSSLSEKVKDLVGTKIKLIGYEGQFKQQINKLVADTKFYETNDNCPTCTQAISLEIKSEQLESAKSNAKELASAIEKSKEKTIKLDEQIARLNEQLDISKKTRSEISFTQSTITRLQKQITDLNTEITEMTGSTNDLSKARSDYDDLIEESGVLVDRKSSVTDTKSYYELSQEMLKDTGIKTKIIKEYIPVMNQLINSYLGILDFFVSFNLDENFNEVIRSRHRDDFNYASFSEGEKQRINLALLFTWRQVARMKNSTSTNLLLLDEVFDASIDEAGVENLMKILDTLDSDTNVFVISHKGEILDDKFRSKIEFVKHHNFSEMVV